MADDTPTTPDDQVPAAPKRGRGRPKTGTQTRAEQLAAAQARHRERQADAGRKPLTVWLSPATLAYLGAIQDIHGKTSHADALELVLEAAMKGELLQRVL